MGKGDRKSKKGKIFKGSFGNTRPRPNASNDNATSATAKPKAEKKPDTDKKTATAKKTTATKKTSTKKKTEKADK